MEEGTAIDAQFRRAVEIVQGLPKMGPIQTGYEEKLAMYSLYKQATVGDVRQQRPGMWDMLGRAKWDAWEQRKGLEQAQAKWLYVDTLQKVLRKYSDRTVARDLVRELDAYGTDPTDLAVGGVSPEGARTSSSGSSRSASPGVIVHEPSYPVHMRSSQELQHQELQNFDPNTLVEINDLGSEGEQESDSLTAPPGPPVIGRPQSSSSSYVRYRTPVGSTYGFTQVAMPSVPSLPGAQPIPRYSSPVIISQHPGPLPPPPTSSVSYPTSLSYPQDLSTTSGSVSGRYYGPAPRGGGPSRLGISSSTPLGRSPLERAIESLQTSLAALHERIETMEHHMSEQASPRINNLPSGQRSGVGSPSRTSYFLGASGTTSSSSFLPFDPDQTGAWSLLLKPLARVFARIQSLLYFLTHPPNPQTNTTSLIIIRRLLLDLSFALFVVLLIKKIWRVTGFRRQLVLKALIGVWHAITGQQARVLVDRAV